MARLFKHQEDSPEGKYLVQRRDGSIPQWPSFVLSAADPAAPAALRAYAHAAKLKGMDPQYVEDVLDLAMEFDNWRKLNGAGDPDAPRHRTDDPAIIAKMKLGHST